MLAAFNVIDEALKILLDGGQLDFDETRQALNCRQCINHMKGLAIALEVKDETEYARSSTCLVVRLLFS